MKKENELIIRMACTNIYEIEPDEVLEMTAQISHNINISKLRKQITRLIIELSGVSSPSLTASARDIALDDEKRLNLINSLARNLELFDGWVSNVRHNKMDCIENYDAMFSTLLHTQELMQSVVQYGDFKKKEIEKIQSEIDESRRLTINHVSLLD